MNTQHETGKNRKIVVIRSSAMGDVAMTAPVLSEVARRYPGLEIVALTRGFYAPFFDGIPNLTIHHIDFEVAHKGLRGVFRLYRELRKFYPEVETVLDLNDKIYSMLLRVLYKLGGVKTYRIDKGRREKKELTRKDDKVVRQLKTMVERYADVFRGAGFELPPINRDLSFYRRRAAGRVLPSGLELGEGKPGDCFWVGIAPFAKHTGKIYPLVKIETVMEQLIARYDGRLRIFVFGGGAEEKMKANLLAEKFGKFDGSVVSVVGRINLREEMDLMAHLDVMVSMDSSSMHIASLVGLPVVSVWGATHPYAGFLGLGQSMDDAVGAGAEQGITCRPCSVFGNKECRNDKGKKIKKIPGGMSGMSEGYYACLNRLEPRWIVERIEAHLSDINKSRHIP